MKSLASKVKAISVYQYAIVKIEKQNLGLLSL